MLVLKERVMLWGTCDIQHYTLINVCFIRVNNISLYMGLFSLLTFQHIILPIKCSVEYFKVFFSIIKKKKTIISLFIKKKERNILKSSYIFEIYLIKSINRS